MKNIRLLFILLTLILSGCEKEPVVIKEVFCYDCYREYFEVKEKVQQPFGWIISSDTTDKQKTFLMKVCMTPEDMGQIELYEGETSIVFVSTTNEPNVLGWIKKIERIKCK